MPPSLPDTLKQRLERLQRSLPAALLRRFVEADVMTQSASLAFYTLLSLAPLLMLLLWLTASLYPPAQQALVEQIAGLAGGSVAEVARTVIANASARPDLGSLAGAWSLLLLFVGATVVFAHLPSLLPAVGYLSTLLLYALGFAFLYHYLPDRPVAWRQALGGGAITALLFTLGRYGIGLYLANAAPGSAYGSMGTLVLMLVWVYYASVVFFSGALVTAVIDERARS